ncbi:MAG TPA: universal stress protein [Povalibacter sp.]|mgnify:CR=1 FL=1|uniref:universal stress protein n=1 Tax=Povalibacter sp. TaxID=1962978 RepID=UPI002B8A842C|nr:universal stress protein [Povalibacter sp.]HMN47487.1 universal stress protein [Povalibacter sp.]
MAATTATEFEAMPRLLCATDLLPKSEIAIDRAGWLADELTADLSLLHVVSPVSSDRALEQTLEIAVARLQARGRQPLRCVGPEPEVVVRAGGASRAILDSLVRTRPDLLILGPHEPRRGTDTLQGTVAEKAVSARVCPVLIVRRNADGRYRNVLLALDTSARSRAAVRAAERLVLTRSARTTVIHAHVPPHVLLQEISGPAVPADSVRADATELMHQLLEEESTNPRRYGLVVADGNPATTILHAIQEIQPDLLVVGTRGDGRMRRALLGSVANQLLKEATCDVLIVPHPLDAAPALEAKTTRRPRARTSSSATAQRQTHVRLNPDSRTEVVDES